MKYSIDFTLKFKSFGVETNGMTGGYEEVRTRTPCGLICSVGEVE